MPSLSQALQIAVPLTFLIGATAGSAQQLPNTTSGTPCCGIIGINKTTGIVTATENTTGRAFQFKLPAARITTVAIGDPVSVDMNLGTVTAVKRLAVAPAVMMEPEDAVPCCSVIQIEPDASQPCCAIVTAKDNASGAEFEFRVTDANLRNTIKTGDPVFRFADTNDATLRMRTTGTVKWFNDARTRTARSNPSEAEPLSAFSYKVIGSEKWKLVPNAALNGAMGRLIVSPPANSSYFVGVFRTGSTESRAAQYVGTNFMLLPGSYDVKVAHDNSPLRVRGVPIQRGMDTRLAVGQLSLNLPQTQWTVMDEAKEGTVWIGYGQLRLGLPVGTYYVKVNDEFSKVRVRDGQITQF